MEGTGCLLVWGKGPSEASEERVAETRVAEAMRTEQRGGRDHGRVAALPGGFHCVFTERLLYAWPTQDGKEPCTLLAHTECVL